MGKKKNYWGKEQDVLVNTYISSEGTAKERCGSKLIQPLMVMSKAILYRYYSTYYGIHDWDIVALEGVNEALIKLEVFDSTKSKSYSFCSLIIKRFYYNKWVKLKMGEEKMIEALRNYEYLSNVIFRDDDADLNEVFVTIDKNIEDFDIITPIERVKIELVSMLVKIKTKRRELEQKLKYRNPIHKDKVTLQYHKTDINALTIMIEELTNMEDDFSFERWIIQLIKRNGESRHKIINQFKRFGFSTKRLTVIDNSYFEPENKPMSKAKLHGDKWWEDAYKYKPINTGEYRYYYQNKKKIRNKKK